MPTPDLKRSDYADPAIDAMLAVAGLQGGTVCDIGAGVTHQTLMLAMRGFTVTAVEPNDDMRANGALRTAQFPAVSWLEGVGEATGAPGASFDLVTFGSSFNVWDRALALRETARLLKPRGWFSCMWNHCHPDDPIQTAIESIIKVRVPAYSYGTRCEDQTAVIDASGLFGPVVHLDAVVHHQQRLEECVRRGARMRRSSVRPATSSRGWSRISRRISMA